MATATIRFQTLILSLLEKGIINITDKVWNFNILSREVSGFAKLAIEDLLLWLKNLCKLKKIPYYNQKINISYCNSESEFVFNSKDINVDFSLLRRWTDENKNNREVIYIRTDYYDRANYFNVSTADPIKYEIVNDGKDSDIPVLKFLLKNIFGFDEFNFPPNVFSALFLISSDAKPKPP